MKITEDTSVNRISVFEEPIIKLNYYCQLNHYGELPYDS